MSVALAGSAACSSNTGASDSSSGGASFAGGGGLPAGHGGSVVASAGVSGKATGAGGGTAGNAGQNATGAGNAGNAGNAGASGSHQAGGSGGQSGVANQGGTGAEGGSGGAPARTRPRILLALHGSNGLANNADWDDQWTYVRANLDGYWGNNAGISGQEEAALWKKIAGRTLITEWDSVDKADFVSPNQFTGAEQYMPGVIVNREQICLYADPPSLWNGTTIADANANYVTNAAVSAAHRFKSVCTGFQPFAPGALTGAARSAYQDSAATFIEYPATAWTLGAQKDNFVNSWKATHAKGSGFIWFNSIYDDTTIHDWLASTKAAYTDIEAMGDVIQAKDVIILMNYGGRLPSVPETTNGVAAESTTGIAYWLLHQP